MAYQAGLREAEIVGLKPNDIDLAHKTMFIRQGKGNKDRITNLPRNFKREWMKEFPLDVTTRALRYAFLNSSLRAGFNSVIYIDKLGHKRYRYHLHSLRAGFITRCIEKGVPINQVQMLVGHENLATTSRYTKANPIDALTSVIERDV